MATDSENIPLGMTVPSFSLPGVDGRRYSLADFGSNPALVVMFICNHCPYVQAVEDRLIALAKAYQPRGVGFLAIMSNDVTRYPDDHPARMKERAAQKGYPFPYVYDETQEVARAFGAACTPDLFLFDGQQKLVYHGRLDDSWKDPAQVKRHDLSDAIAAVLAGNKPDSQQLPCMGCSLKWK